MTMDWPTKIMTYVLLGLMTAIFGVISFSSPTLNIIYMALFLGSIFFIVWLFSPKAVAIQNDNLIIFRPIGKLKYPLGKMISAKVFDIHTLRKEAGFILRTGGSGGLWGSFGHFWSKKWGHFKVHVTRNDKIVMLKTNESKRIVISPNKEKEFIDALGLHK